ADALRRCNETVSYLGLTRRARGVPRSRQRRPSLTQADSDLNYRRPITLDVCDDLLGLEHPADRRVRDLRLTSRKRVREERDPHNASKAGIHGSRPPRITSAHRKLRASDLALPYRPSAPPEIPKRRSARGP